MAKIVIEINQLTPDGAVFSVNGNFAVPIATKVEVEGTEDEKLAMIIAHKLAQTYTATLNTGIESVIKAMCEGGEL